MAWNCPCFERSVLVKQEKCCAFFLLLAMGVRVFEFFVRSADENASLASEQKLGSEVVSVTNA